MDVLTEASSFYCRFCAEYKKSEKLMQLPQNPEQLKMFTKQLHSMKLKLYRPNNHDTFLQNTVCFVCWSNFNEAYGFCERFRRAQAILRELISHNFSSDHESQKNDLMAFDCDSDDDKPLIRLGKSPTANKRPVEPSKLDSCKTSGSNEEVIKNSFYYNSEPDLDSTEAVYDVEDKIFYGEKYNDAQTILEDSKINLNDYTSDSKGKNVLDDQSQILEHGNKNIQLKDFTLQLCDTQSLSGYSIILKVNDKKDIKHQNLLNTRKRTKHKNKSSKSAPTAMDNKTIKPEKEYVLDEQSCDICKKYFATKNNALRHRQTHFKKGTEPSQYTCEHCKSIFNKKGYLKMHQENAKCIEKLQNPKAFPRKHKKRLGPDGQPLFLRRNKSQPITEEERTCPDCKKIFATIYSMRQHKKHYHDTLEPEKYTCECCGKCFRHKNNLNVHLLSHQEAKPYQCKICSAAFPTHGRLRIHLKAHLGSETIECNECNKKFKNVKQLKIHKIVHTDNKPFKCHFCPKTFHFKTNCITHEYQHTGVRPYSCEECGMKFTNWGNWNKHSIRRHGKERATKKLTQLGTVPIDAHTGEVKAVTESEELMEWKDEILKPLKRGHKKGYKRIVD